ncbi:TonB-dependent siderophore receptor [Undibacterium sp. TC4M20W]|uniref:TonB-dependent siderophore receptor n=1 Tax=Undibacterium sp. TC4M20W TaxID=3413052 RepID=UPI003BF1494B
MRRSFLLQPLPLAHSTRRAPITATLTVCAALVASTFMATSAFAQTAATASRSYNIAAQPMGDALNTWARQAGVQMSLQAFQVTGKTAPAVQGTLADREALDLLLAGSGLVATQDGNTVVIKADASTTTSTATPSVNMQSVNVTANRLGRITEGSESYTPGTIATATRMVLTPRETPQTISVVTRQEMDDFNLNSIDQVMMHTPAISIVTYDSERTEYYARGFAIQNFQYDGIPMTRNSSYSAGNTLSDMALYDRVEVLKGSTGLLTGSGMPGATINLIRKKPTRKFSGNASVSAGTWNTYRGDVDVGGAVNESGSVRVRGVAAYQDRQSNLDRYSRSTSTLYGILEADIAPGTLLTIGGDFQNNEPKASTWGGIPLLNSKGEFNDMPRSHNNGTNWSHWDQYTRTAFATLEHKFANSWIARLQYNHQINGYDAALGAAASGYPNPADGKGVSMWVGKYVGRTTSDAFDGYVSGPFTLGGREHELVIGGSLSKSRWTNNGYSAPSSYSTTVPDFYHWQGNVAEPVWPSTPSFGNDETTRERGLYAAARWDLNDSTKLITGGRWSSYRNREQGMEESGVFVPYVGAVVDINKNYSIYASYTNIFSPQSNQDMQGRTLAPVEGKNYEAGVKAAFFGDRLNISAAVFELVQDNFAIETSGLTPSGGIAYRAAQGVKTKGYEMELSGQLAAGWQMHAGYSHNISRQQGERVATLTPSNQFSLYTSYKQNALTLGGGARWQDKTWGDISKPTGETIRHTVDSYWLFDAMARYEFSKQLSASIGVKNLFDKKYYTIFNWYSTYTWGEPRSVNLNMNYKF